MPAAADRQAALRRAAAAGRLPHALLFEGRPGSGARRAAIELARVLFCGSRRDADACGMCADCLQTLALTHPDLILMEPAEGSAGFKVEDVRRVIQRVSLRPFRAPAQLVLIEPADKLNEVSQNALLKTLEEPDAHTHFVLVTAEPDRLLATVRSRTQRYDLWTSGLPSADPEAERLGRLVLEMVLYDIDGAAVTQERRSRAELAMRVPDLSKLERPKLTAIFEELIAYYRDLLLVRAGAGETLAGDSRLPEKKRFAPALDVETICGRIDAFARTKESLAHNANTRVALVAFWDELLDAPVSRDIR